MKIKYTCNGNAVSRDEFLKNKNGNFYEGGCAFAAKNPITISEGAAVHPADREARIEYCKKMGVPTYHDSQGRPHFTSIRHQRKFLKLMGLRDRSGFM